MKKISLFLALLLVCNYTKAQTLVSAVKIATKSTTQVAQVLGSSTGPYNAVNIYKITYNTKDPFNNNTVASGAAFVPSMTCDNFPLVAYCHGTVLKKTEVPSAQYNYNYEGLFFSGKAYVVAMPDYLGLGDNPGYHPYLHSETEAGTTIDLIRAVREFLADSTSIDLNGQVFVTGYSQGGHAAMATLKHIEDNNLQTEFNVIGGAPMSGPYSLSRVQPTTLSDSVYGYNGFSPYVINSYQYVYGNLYNTIDEYYDYPYDTVIPPYLNGNYTFDNLNNSLPTNIYDFMNDSVLDEFMADTILFSTPLRHALKLNDNYAWNSSKPLRLCYCGSDDLVLPGNSTVAADSMTQMGSTSVMAININPAGDHFTCFTPAITYVRNWFDSLKVACTSTVGVTQYDNNNTINFFPNPANNKIQIKSTTSIDEVYLTDLNGKIVSEYLNINKTEFTINTENINNGFYLLKCVDVNNNSTFKKIVISKNM
jgi:pimeloyl-ACP methyl ester carboxylesterase